MILRYEDFRLFILEATNNFGVELFEWNNLSAKSYLENHHNVIYRPLLCKKNYHIMEQLEEFLNVI